MSSIQNNLPTIVQFEDSYISKKDFYSEIPEQFQLDPNYKCAIPRPIIKIGSIYMKPDIYMKANGDCVHMYISSYNVRVIDLPRDIKENVELPKVLPSFEIFSKKQRIFIPLIQDNKIITKVSLLLAKKKGGLLNVHAYIHNLLMKNKKNILNGSWNNNECRMIAAFFTWTKTRIDLTPLDECPLEWCRNNAHKKCHSVKNCPIFDRLKRWFIDFIINGLPEKTGCNICFGKTYHKHCHVTGRTDGRGCKHKYCLCNRQHTLRDHISK